MRCFYCQRPVLFKQFNWGYMIVEEERVVYAHLDCVEWEVLMQRLETEEYLTTVLNW